MNYYLAVAPCTFMLGGQHFKLNAGDTVSLNDALAAQVASPSFKYSKHLKLISKSPEAVKAPEPEVVKEPIKEEPKTPIKKAPAKPEVKIEEK